MCQYGTYQLSKPPPLWPQATFHRPRVGSVVRKHWVHNGGSMQHNIPIIGIKFVSIAYYVRTIAPPGNPPQTQGQDS